MTYTLSVKEDELQLISAGLNELPRRLVQSLFVKLQEQVAVQEKAATVAVAEAAEAAEADEASKS